METLKNFIKLLMKFFKQLINSKTWTYSVLCTTHTLHAEAAGKIVFDTQMDANSEHVTLSWCNVIHSTC